MNKVFVLHDNPYSPRDFTPAEEFGEIVYLFQTHISTHHLPRIAGQLRDKMRGATNEDWLIATGPPALIALAGYIWADMTGNRLRLLAWDNHSHSYIPVEMDLV